MKAILVLQPFLAGSSFTQNMKKFILQQKYVNHQPKSLPKFQIGWEHIPTIPTFLEPCVQFSMFILGFKCSVYCEMWIMLCVGMVSQSDKWYEGPASAFFSRVIPLKDNLKTYIHTKNHQYQTPF